MKALSSGRKKSYPKADHRRQANARVFWLSLVALAAGLAIGALAVYQATRPRRVVIVPGSIVLNDSTKNVLARLRSPVEIRLYALLNPDTAPRPAQEAANHAGELLAEFERQGGGKITIIRLAEWAAPNTKAAAADGLVPFNIDKGDAIYLGLVLSQGTQKHIMPQVLPEWLPALEFDLARAIEKITTVTTAPPPAADAARVSAAEAAVKKLIAKPADVSREDGEKILQEAALKEFQAVTQEMNQAIAGAERQVESAKSEAEKQSAISELQAIRGRFMDQLKEIALRSQAKVEAWDRLKSP